MGNRSSLLKVTQLSSTMMLYLIFMNIDCVTSDKRFSLGCISYKLIFCMNLVGMISVRSTVMRLD